MDRPQMTAAGDLVYLSERKLANLSIQLGLPTDVRDPTDRTTIGAAGVNLGGMAHAELEVTRAGRRVDPNRHERGLHDRLAEVIPKLEPGGLPCLDDGGTEIFEGGWFWFHRVLRFGVGTDDSAHSVRALLAVDEEPVPEGSPWPGLLMNGSPTHVLPPYAVDLADANAMRSGSGSGMLFQWLDRVRAELEISPGREIEDLKLGEMQASPSLRGHATAITMYRMFANPVFDDRFSFSQLLNRAPCEGVAQASLVAVDDRTSVVLASPLYIRIRRLDPVPEPSGSGEPGSRIRRALRIPKL